MRLKATEDNPEKISGFLKIVYKINNGDVTERILAQTIICGNILMMLSWEFYMVENSIIYIFDFR